MIRWISRSALVVGIGLWLANTQSAGPGFMRPSPDSVVDAGPLRIVARGSANAKLLLDGRAVSTTSPGPDALTATVTLTAGRHEMTVQDAVGASTISFFVRAPNAESQAPAGWKSFRTHPPADLKAECQACHSVKNGQWTFAGASLSSNCFQCHQQKEFAGIHTHEPPVLRDCQMCHSAHGSTEAKHLKMPPKAACEQCHPL